jgi:hypothetical protein
MEFVMTPTPHSATIAQAIAALEPDDDELIDLVRVVLGRRFPRCRECADNDGTCPHSSLPCDVWKKLERIAKSLRSLASLRSLGPAPAENINRNEISGPEIGEALRTACSYTEVGAGDGETFIVSAPTPATMRKALQQFLARRVVAPPPAESADHETACLSAVALSDPKSTDDVAIALAAFFSDIDVEVPGGKEILQNYIAAPSYREAMGWALKAVREHHAALPRAAAPARAGQMSEPNKDLSNLRKVIEFADGLYSGTNNHRDQVIDEIVSFAQSLDDNLCSIITQSRADSAPAPADQSGVGLGLSSEELRRIDPINPEFIDALEEVNRRDGDAGRNKLAHDILNDHCACYAEYYPSKSCEDEQAAVSEMLRKASPDLSPSDREIALGAMREAEICLTSIASDSCSAESFLAVHQPERVNRTLTAAITKLEGDRR